jgi:hypothetical protein
LADAIPSLVYLYFLPATSGILFSKEKGEQP